MEPGSLPQWKASSTPKLQCALGGGEGVCDGQLAEWSRSLLWASWPFATHLLVSHPSVGVTPCANSQVSSWQQNFSLLLKNQEKVGGRKGLAEGFRSRKYLLHPGSGGETQGSQKKKGAVDLGSHTFTKLLGKGAGPPYRAFLAGGRMRPLCLLCSE